MKKKVYREVDFATALYEQTHKGAEVEASVGTTGYYSPCNLVQGWGNTSLDDCKSHKFRIVTETKPEYREYQKFEEVPVGKIATYTTRSGIRIRGVLGATCYEAGKCPEIHFGAASFSAKEALERGRFDDGSPCGVEVVE